jgi:hypothetical protein
MITRLLISTIALGLTLAIPVSGQAESPAVLVVRDICPFECCQFGTWTVLQRLQLQRRPGSDTPVAFTVAPGEILKAETGELHLQSVGTVVLRYPLQVRPEGQSATLAALAGDTILVVGYLGEDIWLVRYRDVERAADRFWASNGRAAGPDLPGELVRPLRAQWWARVRDEHGRLGWLQMGQVSAGEGEDGTISTAAIDGEDACS